MAADDPAQSPAELYRQTAHAEQTLQRGDTQLAASEIARLLAATQTAYAACVYQLNELLAPELIAA